MNVIHSGGLTFIVNTTSAERLAFIKALAKCKTSLDQIRINAEGETEQIKNTYKAKKFPEYDNATWFERKFKYNDPYAQSDVDMYDALDRVRILSPMEMTVLNYANNFRDELESITVVDSIYKAVMRIGEVELP